VVVDCKQDLHLVSEGRVEIGKILGRGQGRFDGTHGHGEIYPITQQCIKCTNKEKKIIAVLSIWLE